MNTARFLLILSVIGSIGLGVISGPGCANIVPPGGGPRDSTAPMLKEADPVDSAVNFSGRRIVFNFDEYVEVQNIHQELLVTPTPRITPTVDSRLNTVTVRIRDTLEPNTTYTFDFGNAIKDINEGNVLKNFRYIFSTGPVLDSLTFAGSVILAETGKTDSTLIVMLHTKPEDSAVVNEKPRYVAKLDNKGRFIFRNLPPRTYYVYALKDDNRSLRYLDDKQLFAFGSSPVVVSDSTAPVTLYAYSVKPVQTQTSPTANLNIGAGTKGRGNNPAVDKRLKFTTNLMSGQQDLLSPFIMTFEQPLRFFDSTRMKLYKDSTFTAITAYSITLDSTKTQLQLVTSWQENSPYQLVFDKDFAEDSIGRKLLRTDTMRFATKRIADHGQWW